MPLVSLNPDALAFASFVEEYGGNYPYCDVLLTRTSFHTRWLFMYGTNHGIVHAGPLPSWKAVPTSVFDKGTVQQLIVSGQALPAPREMCDILDCVDYWGRALDPEWYFKMVELMASWCSDGFAPNTELLLGQCIQMRVRRMLDQYSGMPWLDGTHGSELEVKWLAFFLEEFHDRGHSNSKDFYQLCVVSIHFVEAMITEEQQNVLTGGLPPAVVVSDASP